MEVFVKWMEGQTYRHGECYIAPPLEWENDTNILYNITTIQIIEGIAHSMHIHNTYILSTL